MAFSSSSSNTLFSYIVINLFICSCLLNLPQTALSQCKSSPIIFNFGDSNSDTGGLVSGLGYPLNLPNGRTFFNRSTGRVSDGRLVIDFLCESAGTGFLNPYMESVGSTFTNGANFAVAGSSTLPRSQPFALNVQVMQFLHFKARSLQLIAEGSLHMINDEGFRSALYTIDIGQNDLSNLFSSNLSYANVIKNIPSILAEIKTAVKTIYDQGGRKFWVHNTGPLGCLPQKLSSVDKTSQDVDQNGCLSIYNSAARLFNEGLRQLCQQMRSELKGSTVVYVDVYAIKYDLIANAAQYGFSNPLMACCGSGGPPYNSNKQLTCGLAAAQAQVCTEQSKFVNWDGIHYTEAANSIVASKILSSVYSTPRRVTFDFFCQ